MPPTTAVLPRILILSTAYLPHIGGSELAIHNIARRLPQYEFDVVTGRLNSGQPAGEHIGRVRVFRAGGRLSGLTLTHPKFFLPFAMALTAWRLARSHRYILMHAYQVAQAAGAAWLVHLVRPSLPFVVTLQEGKALDRQTWPVRWARALILRSANRITAISTYLAHYARRYNRTPAIVIPNGVDVASMQVSGITRELHTVVTVSRLVHKNNVENLIRAMVGVRASVPDARLLVAGDGPLRGKLEVITNELGLSDSVDFLGSIPNEELPAVMARAGVFARPSLSEGLGSAFLEAMAAHVPVVASDVGGIPDIVEDNRTGLICNPMDPPGIAHAIIRLMTDAQLRETITAAAYEMVRMRYDWSNISEKMAAVYQSLTPIS